MKRRNADVNHRPRAPPGKAPGRDEAEQRASQGKTDGRRSTATGFRARHSRSAIVAGRCRKEFQSSRVEELKS